MIVSLLLVAADTKKHTFGDKVIWTIRLMFMAPPIIISIWATTVYSNLRKNMEVDKWYGGDKENVFTFDQNLV
jgi:hypothetical protein